MAESYKPALLRMTADSFAGPDRSVKRNLVLATGRYMTRKGRL